MAEDLAESIADQDAIVIVEWGESVADILPENRTTYQISLNDDGSRTIAEIKQADNAKNTDNTNKTPKEPK